MSRNGGTIDFLILVTPHFNLNTTTAFLDPFRVANYISGKNTFRWRLVSLEDGTIQASNGMLLATEPLNELYGSKPTIAVISTSWAPEAYQGSDMVAAVLRLSKAGAMVGGLDTGGFILAKAGLLNGKKATVHYEHIDAFSELFPKVTVTESLFEMGTNHFTCCGGIASTDLALALLRSFEGEGLANATARYLFHHNVRGEEASQNPSFLEPYGRTTPSIVRQAIDFMESNLEETVSIPDICEQLHISQRHLNRLFKKFVHKTPVLYYRDIRLDRARGLVTQTEMKLSEVAVASGFASQVYFSRAYKDRFGLSPTQDRIEGRVPFGFRAWPMHSPRG